MTIAIRRLCRWKGLVLEQGKRRRGETGQAEMERLVQRSGEDDKQTNGLTNTPNLAAERRLQ